MKNILKFYKNYLRSNFDGGFAGMLLPAMDLIIIQETRKVSVAVRVTTWSPIREPAATSQLNVTVENWCIDQMLFSLSVRSVRNSFHHCRHKFVSCIITVAISLCVPTSHLLSLVAIVPANRNRLIGTISIGRSFLLNLE